MTLTPRQTSVLTAIRKHGMYPKNWYIDSPEYTERTLGHLEQQGYVSNDDGIYRPKEYP